MATLTSTAIVGFPRHTASGTYTANSELAAYPATKLGTLPIRSIWRSDGLATDPIELTVTFATKVKVGLIVLGLHNLSTAATTGYDLYYESTDVSPMHSQAMTKVWPAIYSEDQVDWDGGRWWDRTYTASEIAGYPWYLAHWVNYDSPYCEKVVFKISDPDNPDGHVQAGLLEIAEAHQLDINFARGAQYGYRGRAEVVESDGGTKFRRVRPKPRKFNGAVDRMPRDDALAVWMEMRRQLDIAVPFFWWPDPTDTTHGIRQAFMAHFTELDMQAYVSEDVDSVPVSLEEEM